MAESTDTRGMKTEVSNSVHHSHCSEDFLSPAASPKLLDPCPLAPWGKKWTQTFKSNRDQHWLVQSQSVDLITPLESESLLRIGQGRQDMGNQFIFFPSFPSVTEIRHDMKMETGIKEGCQVAACLPCCTCVLGSSFHAEFSVWNGSQLTFLFSSPLA